MLRLIAKHTWWLSTLQRRFVISIHVVKVHIHFYLPMFQSFNIFLLYRIKIVSNLWIALRSLWIDSDTNCLHHNSICISHISYHVIFLLCIVTLMVCIWISNKNLHNEFRLDLIKIHSCSIHVLFRCAIFVLWFYVYCILL